jgi:hypothetical protein
VTFVTIDCRKFARDRFRRICGAAQLRVVELSELDDRERL